MDKAVVDLDSKTGTPLCTPRENHGIKHDSPLVLSNGPTPLQTSRQDNEVPFEDSGESIIVHKRDTVASDLGILKLIPGLNLASEIKHKPSGITSLMSPVESSPDIDRF